MQDCTCCGVHAYADPEPLATEEEECDCGCFSCPDCPDCFHDDDDAVAVDGGVAVVLCNLCDADGDCDPGAWHCDGRGGHSCDGSGCEEYPVDAHLSAVS